MNSSNTAGKRRLLLMIFYEGPWAKLSNLCYGIRKDGELRFEVPIDPRGWRWVLAELGDFFERCDHSWRGKYVTDGTLPHKRWKRQMP